MPNLVPRPSDDLRLLEDLLHATITERERAWLQFVQRFDRLIHGTVRRTLVRWTGSAGREHVEDLAGEAWMQLLRDDLRRLRRFDPARGCRLSTFIALIATNHTIDQIRRQRMELESLESITAEHSALCVAQQAWCPIETRQHAALAQAAVDKLSASDRAFVAEVYCDERDPADMAREQGVTTTTIYTRKTKVRDKLRRLVGELESARRMN